MTKEEKEHFMTLALEESRKALPTCRPNPPVGCVLVQDGKVVARGFTQPPGEDHAEAMALRNFRGSLDDVSVFVTLEPCSFEGRTPSCAIALIGARPGEVFVSLLDPHPRNQGEGVRLLRQAGVMVETGILEERVSRFIRPYLHCGEGNGMESAREEQLSEK